MVDAGNAQIHFGEVVDGDGGRDVLAAGGGFFRFRRGGRLKQGFEQFRIDALHQVLVHADGVARAQRGGGIGKGEGFAAQKGFDVARQCGQHGFEQSGQYAEGFDAGGTHVLQARFHARLLGQLPRFVGIHVLVDAVGQRHRFADGFAVFAFGVEFGNGGHGGLQVVEQRVAIGRDGAQPTAKAFGDEARCARGDVDVLAHQIGVNAGSKIVRVEVHVLDAAVEFGGQVVAQPLGVHAQLQVLERVDAGAPAFAHLFTTIHGDKAVDVDLRGRFAATEVQHGGPEQGVEVGDVFADEVDLFHRGVGHKLLVALWGARGFVPVVGGLALGKVVF